jgi:hypothetical protein
MNPRDAVKAVLNWNNDEKRHPLTCSEHSMVPLIAKIHKKKVVLLCRYCNYRQTHIPEVIFENYLLSKIFGENDI